MSWRGSTAWWGWEERHHQGSNLPLPLTGCETLGKSRNLPGPGVLDKMQGVVQGVILKLCLSGLGFRGITWGQAGQGAFLLLCYILAFDRISFELMVLRL